MILLINLMVFCTVVLLGVLLFNIMLNSKSQVNERLHEIAKMDDSDDEDIMKKPFSERVIEPFFSKLATTLSNLAPAEIKNSMEKKIIYAGSPKNMSVNTILMLQFILGAGLPIALLTLLRLSGPINSLPILIILLAAIGFFGPLLFINSKVTNRQKIIKKTLPDILDLLLVSVEAGLGFDMALKRVVEKKPGELSKEFNRALEEIRVGKVRSEALRGVYDRTGVPDIRAFVSAIIQAEQLGSSISRTLDIQAETMRLKRRQRAEETAMKVPIKMIFPIVFFIFPALLLVVLGPSIIGLLRFFGSGGF